MTLGATSLEGRRAISGEALRPSFRHVRFGRVSVRHKLLIYHRSNEAGRSSIQVQNVLSPLLPPTHLSGSIVSLTSPFVSSLHRSQKSRRCSRCFLPFTSPTSKRLKCTGCPPNGSTYYCSRTCQISDFITHRYECKKKGTKSLQAAVNTFVLTHGEDGTNFPLDDYWLLRKTYYMAVFQVKSDGGNMKGLVPDLPTKLSKLSEHHIPSDVVLAESVTQSVIALEKGKVEEEDVSNLQKFFVNLLAKFRANNFGILSDLQNVIGGGVYETGTRPSLSLSDDLGMRYSSSSSFSYAATLSALKRGCRF